MSTVPEQFRRPMAAEAALSAAAPARAAAASAPVRAPGTAPDPRIKNARPQLVRFLGLAGQLVLLLAVFSVFNLENPGFGRLLAAIVGAFLVHYWLPFRLKEPFWVAASLAGSFWLLDLK